MFWVQHQLWLALGKCTPMFLEVPLVYESILEWSHLWHSTSRRFSHERVSEQPRFHFDAPPKAVQSSRKSKRLRYDKATFIRFSSSARRLSSSDRQPSVASFFCDHSNHSIGSFASQSPNIIKCLLCNCGCWSTWKWLLVITYNFTVFGVFSYLLSDTAWKPIVGYRWFCWTARSFVGWSKLFPVALPNPARALKISARTSVYISTKGTYLLRKLVENRTPKTSKTFQNYANTSKHQTPNTIAYIAWRQTKILWLRLFIQAMSELIRDTRRASCQAVAGSRPGLRC